MFERIVTLLRVANRLIFHDRSSIEPGDEWETKIMESLKLAQSVIVIWCSHASESKWVKKESRVAVSLGKRVVPLADR